MLAPTTTEVTQLTAPNETVDAANGIVYTYRRFGNALRGVSPVLFLQHFRGNLDNWDPALVDGIAGQREVILFDNAGVGRSSGRAPDTFTAMAHDALAFVDAWEFGRSTSWDSRSAATSPGAHPHPPAARAPAGAGRHRAAGRRRHARMVGEVFEMAMADEPTGENLLYLFFERTPDSVAKGWEFVQRIFIRTEDRDHPVSLAVRDVQYDAYVAWGIPDPTRLGRLAGISQPTLVANGDNDLMVPTRNSRLLARNLPNAQLSIYPSAGHGFLFQYPSEFADEVNHFLG